MTQALLNDGHNVIIDEVCLDQEAAKNWQKILSEFNVFYIEITTDLTTLYLASITLSGWRQLPWPVSYR
jgi:hypothetical protein